MRITTMTGEAHAGLLAKLARERKEAESAVRLIEGNVERGWSAIPAMQRRQQEERLPRLRDQIVDLGQWIAALESATA